MSIDFRRKCSTISAIAVMALLAMTTTAVQAETIVTDSFNLAYGCVGDYVWDTSEITDGSNDSVSGDFQLNLTFSGIHMSPGGPAFANRTLTDGEWGDSCAAKFAVDIEAIYTGDVPEDASIKLVIDSISIWGQGSAAYASVASENNGNQGILWQETTTDTTVTSDWLTLNNTSTYYGYASPYGQLVWNPDDTGLEVTESMTTTRSFNVYANTTYAGAWVGNAALDGFEVSGQIEVEYAEVPEPATWTLMILATLAVVVFNRRRR